MNHAFPPQPIRCFWCPVFDAVATNTPVASSGLCPTCFAKLEAARAAKANGWTLAGFIAKLTLILLVAVQVQALDLKPYAVLIAGQSADILSTQRFLTGTRCTEGNRLLGARPSTTKLLASGAVTMAGASLFTYLTSKSPSKFVRTLGKGASYFGGGMGFFDAGRNVSLCGWSQ
jgi:hypothetical protein